MKNYLRVIIFLSLLNIGCDSRTTSQEKINENRGTEQSAIESGNFGKAINGSGAIEVDDMKEKLKGKDSLQIKVTGSVTSVCQSKGCWMKVDLGNDETMQVTFKDYGFFVPKDAAGKTAILEGIVKNKIISVESLRHFAEDAGKSPEEVLAINKPEEQIVFEAEGVILE